MEDTISLILHGFKLVRDFESEFPNLANHNPTLIAKYCDEIVNVFGSAKERLNAQAQAHTSQLVDASLHEWLRSSYAHSAAATGSVEQLHELVSGVPLQLKGGGDDMSDCGKSSSTQRPQKRKDNENERRIMRVAAPKMGNTEIPPEDGFTWRKYGQKEILGSRFPRGYYRCTHQKLYQCPAKKQVQRLDNDPFTFEVTYRGDHTCHMSATAPSILPLSAAAEPTSSVPLSRWLEFSIIGGRGGGGGGGGGGSSSSRYVKEADQYPVADMADAMFNSGSSSTNSMDFIFTNTSSYKEDKGEHEDKQN